MTTEQTAQQLELAAQILRTGHPWEYRNGDTHGWCDGHRLSPAVMLTRDEHSEIRLALATPPDGRPLHNPDNLTAEQVGAGWRLTLADEKLDRNYEYWHKTERRWYSSVFYDETVTYRLPLSVPWPEVEKPAPTFQLPPPPPGMQWHREDGWKEGDLSQGLRPLVINEESQPGDEHWTLGRGPWKTLKEGGIIYDEGHTRCRTRRPLTFTHAGKQWTWHRPGDPMPCDGERYVALLQQLDLATFIELGSNGTSLGREWHWGDDLIIGWRYADEKKTVPLGPEDVPPCSMIRNKDGVQYMVQFSDPAQMRFSGRTTIGLDALGFRAAMEDGYQINRSIPMTGKWNHNAWEPCHKIIP